MVIVIDTTNKNVTVKRRSKRPDIVFSIYITCDYQKGTENEKHPAFFIITNHRQMPWINNIFYNKPFKLLAHKVRKYKVTDNAWIAKQDKLEVMYNDLGFRKKDRIFYMIHSSDYFNPLIDSVKVIEVRTLYGGVQIE